MKVKARCLLFLLTQITQHFCL